MDFVSFFLGIVQLSSNHHSERSDAHTERTASSHGRETEGWWRAAKRSDCLSEASYSSDRPQPSRSSLGDAALILSLVRFFLIKEKEMNKIRSKTIISNAKMTKLASTNYFVAAKMTKLASTNYFVAAKLIKLASSNYLVGVKLIKLVSSNYLVVAKLFKLVSSNYLVAAKLFKLVSSNYLVGVKLVKLLTDVNVFT